MNNGVVATRDEVLQTYQGLGSPTDCSLPFIATREARIREKFSELGYFKKASKIDQSLIYLKCMKLNHLEIIKTLGSWTFMGGVIGGVAGAAGHAPGIAGGAAIGAGAGAAAGALWCYHKGLYSKEEHIVSIVRDSTEYSRFKKERTKEQYELFVAFFKNYAEHVDAKHENRILDFVCRITLDIPEYPVFSPYDTKRAQPFEKAAIEEHIDGIEKKIADYQSDREKMISEYREVHTFASGLPEAKIEKDIQAMRLETEKGVERIRSTICLFGGKPYTKEELIYDPDYCKTVIAELRNIQQELLGSLSRDQDPIIIKGVNALVDHYTTQYTQVNDALIKKLAKDIFAIDGDITLANQASEQVSKLLNKV
ncbi:MAG: DUF6861 domain-containing protein [Parachlamydiaceae bacterium]